MLAPRQATKPLLQFLRYAAKQGCRDCERASADEAECTMPHIPGLRSCYAKVGRLVYFGRMLDKIRLHAAGQLPASHVANLGEGQPFWFDARCCRFLGVSYEELRTRTLRGGNDEEILAWVEGGHARRTDDDCTIW